jgi:hypothetical protein
MFWAVLVIANAISLTFTFIGLKWMRIYFYDRYTIHKYLTEQFRGMPAAKTIGIFYAIGSVFITGASILVAFYI